jgi:23S rRNA (pseudouridine1915-N3)-methyltransferase
MQIVLLCITSDHPDWAKEAQQAYIKKIKNFTPFEIKDLKPKKHGRDQADYKKKSESDLLLEQLKDHDYVVLLDEKGKDLDSIEFSKRLSRWQISGKKRLIFIIGGAYGVTDDIKNRSQETLKLSSLTFNHLVAQTVLLEQIYRGLTILKGLPYHNA